MEHVFSYNQVLAFDGNDNIYPAIGHAVVFLRDGEPLGTAFLHTDIDIARAMCHLLGEDNDDPRNQYALREIELIVIETDEGEFYVPLISGPTPFPTVEDTVGKIFVRNERTKNPLFERVLEKYPEVAKGIQTLIRRGVLLPASEGAKSSSSTPLPTDSLPHRPEQIDPTDALEELAEEIGEGRHPVADKKREVSLDPPPSTDDPLGHSIPRPTIEVVDVEEGI